jgi:hypothetical protein
VVDKKIDEEEEDDPRDERCAKKASPNNYNSIECSNITKLCNYLI